MIFCSSGRSYEKYMFVVLLLFFMGGKSIIRLRKRQSHCNWPATSPFHLGGVAPNILLGMVGCGGRSAG